jgi:CubicO group peptidase (beta-lactamase class C family)
MNKSRKNARWAGIFFIIATAAPISTIFFLGFLGGGIAGETVPDYLVVLSAQQSRVIIGMFIELIWALAVVGIPVTLFPVLKKHNEALALGFFGLRFMEAVSTVIHSIGLLSLLTLSREYAAAGMPAASHFQTAGALLLSVRDWAFLIGSGLIWSLSALILNYLLYQRKLVPRWLSAWGFVGAALSFVNYLPQFFGVASLEILFIPIAVQEMVFAVWLIAKGLEPPAIASGSVKKKTSLAGFVVLAVSMLLAACVTKPQFKPTAPGDYDGAFEYLSAYIEGRMKKSGVVGMSIAVVSDNEILWTRGFGYADKERGIEVTPGTLFDPASVAKVFTATALMQLVEQGKVDLDRPVTDYLPEFSMKSRFSATSGDITVRQLCTHHSGIPGDRFKGMLSANPEAFVKYKRRFLSFPAVLQDEYLAHPPGHTWAYSNLGVSLLGCIIDRVSGGSYFEYLKDNVLAAVGMTKSTFDMDAGVISSMTKGYEKGREVPLLFESTIPTGSLAVSAEEMALFLMSYLDETDTRLLRSETKEEMFARQNGHVKRDIDFSQGLVWMIGDFGFENLGRTVFHDGGEHWSNARVMLLLEQKIGLAIMTNSAEGSDFITEITPEIIRVLYETKTGRRAEENRDLPRREIQIPVPKLENLEGTYFYPSLGIVEMEERRGKLYGFAGGMKLRYVFYDNGRFGLKPLLLGFIPIRIGFLEPFEIGFNEIEGDMISPVYSWGSPLEEIGIRIEKPKLTEVWQARQGTYEVSNLDDDFPVLSPWELEIQDGIPFLVGNLFGSKNMRFGIPIMPVNDTLALTGSGSIGRRSGETVIFGEKAGETYFTYAGYRYRKTK